MLTGAAEQGVLGGLDCLLPPQTITVRLVGSLLQLFVSLVGSSLQFIVCPVETAVVQSLGRNPHRVGGRLPFLSLRGLLGTWRRRTPPRTEGADPHIVRPKRTP